MDTTLNDYLEYVPAAAKSKIQKLIAEVKAVQGTFVLLFHNETLSETDRWKGWSKMYKELVAELDD